MLLNIDYLLFALPGIALSLVGAGADLLGLRGRLADPGFLGPDGSRGGGSRDAGGWSRARGDRASGRPVDRSL